MVQTEKIIIKLIDWAYQSIFNWIGVGIASLIGLFEIKLEGKKRLSINSLFYVGFFFAFLFSVEKVLEHWKFIQLNRYDLITVYGWNPAGTELGIFTNWIDLLLRRITSFPDYRLLFLIVLIIIGIEFYQEKRNERHILTIIYEYIMNN